MSPLFILDLINFDPKNDPLSDKLMVLDLILAFQSNVGGSGDNV